MLPGWFGFRVGVYMARIAQFFTFGLLVAFTFRWLPGGHRAQEGSKITRNDTGGPQSTRRAEENKKGGSQFEV